jgi:hypothetical protein
LKKKDCVLTPAEIVVSLKKRAGKLRGRKLVHHETTKFASVWYREMDGRVINRLLDETELYFILGDRTYTQHICAVQVFFGGMPVKGCGIFEHYVTRSSHKVVHKTFESIHLPPPLDILALGKQPPGHAAENTLPDHPRPSSPIRQEHLAITETQNDILTIASGPIMKALQQSLGSRVIGLRLVFYFNSTWLPFVVACTAVTLESKNAIVPDHTIAQIPISPESSNPHLTIPGSTNQQGLTVVTVSTEYGNEQKSPFPKKPSLHREFRVSGIYSTESEGIQVVPKKDEGGGGRVNSTPSPHHKSPTKHDNSITHNNNTALHTGEDKKIIASKFGGKRLSVIDNFISITKPISPPKAMSTEIHNNSPFKPVGVAIIEQQRNRPQSAGVITVATGRKGVTYPWKGKTFYLPTDATSTRFNSYSSQIKGMSQNHDEWREERGKRERRPITAPNQASSKARFVEHLN